MTEKQIRDIFEKIYRKVNPLTYWNLAFGEIEETPYLYETSEDRARDSPFHITGVTIVNKETMKPEKELSDAVVWQTLSERTEGIKVILDRTKAHYQESVCGGNHGNNGKV